MREAVALVRRALAIDPSYAPAAALIGWCHYFQRVQGWGVVSDAEISEAVRQARQAIEAGRDDPDVLAMAGITFWVFALIADGRLGAAGVVQQGAGAVAGATGVESRPFPAPGSS